jgi:hypothetical protein
MQRRNSSFGSASAKVDPVLEEIVPNAMIDIDGYSHRYIHPVLNPKCRTVLRLAFAPIIAALWSSAFVAAVVRIELS